MIEKIHSFGYQSLDMRTLIAIFFVAAVLLFTFFGLPKYLKNRSLEPDEMVGMIDNLIEEVIPVKIDSIPNAYNPGLSKYKDHFLMVFRYDAPDNFTWERLKKKKSPYLAVVELGNDFKPLSKPKRLITKPNSTEQAEDPRLIEHNGHTYVFFNDSPSGHRYGQRKMFFAELNDDLELGAIHAVEPPHTRSTCEKNWMPFTYQNGLYVIYSMDPHVVLKINPRDGTVKEMHSTETHHSWQHGELRGGTQAIASDDSFLTFYHSSLWTKPTLMKHKTMRFYFMGAYSFEAKPPFRIKSYTPGPINHQDFYTSKNRRRVIFPSGAIEKDGKMYVAYGENDNRINIAVIDKEKLKENMVPVKEHSVKKWQMSPKR